MNLIRRNLFLIALIAISVVAHWYLFFDFNILNSGDWVFYFNSQFSSLKNYNLYLSPYNLGAINPFGNNWIFYLAYYLLGHLSLTWDLITRLLFLLPTILLTPIVSFFLYKKIFRIDFIAFSAACLYCFNSFFLKLQLDWITYAFLWWVLPALILLIINFFENKKILSLIFISVLTFVGIVYEIRIMLIILITISFFIGLYSWKNNKIKEGLAIMISIFIGIIGHLYWILPFLLTSINSDILNYSSSNIFNSYFNLLDVLTLHSYQWSNNLVYEPFYKQPIDFWYFLIPLISIIGYISMTSENKMKRNKYLIFFSIVLIFSIFLSKQASIPFNTIYSWMYLNIPLFNLYREASKFLIIVAFGLSFFYAYGLYKLYIFLKLNISVKIIPIFLISFILFFSSIFNLQHFIDQKIGGMTKGITIPQDYVFLQKKLNNDNHYYRILWLPRTDRFSFYSETHPFVNAIDLPSLYDKYTNKITPDLPTDKEIIGLFNQRFFGNSIDQMSIKYIILPVTKKREIKINRNNSKFADEIYEYYGKKEAFIAGLQHLNYVKKINYGTKDLIVYENIDFKPHIYLTYQHETIFKSIPYKEIIYKTVKPTEYKLSLKNVTGPIFINFSEAYNPNWNIRIGKFNWFEVIANKSYFIDSKYHTQNDPMLNSFKIDPSYIKTLPKEDYSINSDGSLNIDVTIYFKAQSYTYLGLIISILTFILCLGYLIYHWISRFFKRKSNE